MLHKNFYRYSGRAGVGFMLIISFMLGTGVLALNTVQDGFRIANGSNRDIDAHGVCYNIANTIGKDIFVPTRTSNEWQAFRDHLPTGITRSACIPPSPPVAPILQGTGANKSAVLSWNAVLGATSYRIRHSALSSITLTNLTTVTSTGYTHTGLTNGGTYYYEVIAVNGAGASPASNIVSVTPKAGVLATPVLSGTGGDAQAQLTWNIPPGTDNVIVKRRLQHCRYDWYTQTLNDVGNVIAPAHDYSDHGLQNGCYYVYQVQAISDSAESLLSNEVVIKAEKILDVHVRRLAMDGIPNTGELCVIKSNGEVHCRNSTITDRAKSIAAGAGSVCIIGLDNIEKCYGAGKLPNTLKNKSDISLSPNGVRSCILTETGDMFCGYRSGQALSLSVGMPDGYDKEWSIVRAADNYSCGVTQTGGVECVGVTSNYLGDMGVDTPFIRLNGVVDLATGDNIACALINNGTLTRCWGIDGVNFNLWRQSWLDYQNLKTANQVVVGSAHLCMLYNDETVGCFGNNTYQQTEVPIGLTDVVEIVSARNQTCALKRDDTVVCWGQGITQPIPESQVQSRRLSVGAKDFVCYIKIDKTLNCIGKDMKTPTDTSNKKVIAVADDSACSLSADGLLNCWGSIPATALPNYKSFTFLDAGSRTFGGIRQNGSGICFGSSSCNFPSLLSNIALGDDNFPFTYGSISQVGSAAVSMRSFSGYSFGIGELDDVTYISAQRSDICLVAADKRTIRCKGSYDTGRIAGPGWHLYAFVDFSMTTSQDIVQIAMGTNHICTLQSDKQVQCWYYRTGSEPLYYQNRSDFILDNSSQTITTYGETNIPSDLGSVVEIAAGGTKTCALRDDDTLRCWGSLDYDSQHPVCGDDIKENTEFCDSGLHNGEPGSCNNDCTAIIPLCGNGVQETGEFCDSGSRNGSSGMCNTTCTALLPLCGNARVEVGETCDDGSLNGRPNRCNTTCSGKTSPVCGNDIIERNSNLASKQCYINSAPGCSEYCDDGSNNGTPNHCDAICGNSWGQTGWVGVSGGGGNGGNVICGNGIQEVGEECDQGTQNGQPGKCTALCRNYSPSCGNNVIDSGESCDNGANNANTDGRCRSDCRGIFQTLTCGFRNSPTSRILDRYTSGLCDPGIGVVNFNTNTQYTTMNGGSVRTDNYSWTCINNANSSGVCNAWWQSAIPPAPTPPESMIEKCRGGFRSTPNGTFLCIIVR